MNVRSIENHECYPPVGKGVDSAVGSWEGSLPELRLSGTGQSEQVELDGITKGVHK